MVLPSFIKTISIEGSQAQVCKAALAIRIKGMDTTLQNSILGRFILMDASSLSNAAFKSPLNLLKFSFQSGKKAGGKDESSRFSNDLRDFTMTET